MATTAEIAARKAALRLIKDGFNSTANSVNAGSDALKPFKAEYQSLIGSFNDVVVPQNVLGPAILEAIAATDALVPSDPPVVTFSVPPLALNAGGSVSIAEYYRGPAAVFTASGLPPGVMLNQSGLLDAAADAPDSVSTIALTATEQ